MNHGSRVLLESLDAWPERSADIRSIHVSQRGRLGRSLIRHTDFDSWAAWSAIRASTPGSKPASPSAA